MGSMSDSRDDVSDALVSALIGKLFETVLQVSNIQPEDLDNTNLLRPVNLGSPVNLGRLPLTHAIPRPLFRRSLLSPQPRFTDSAFTAKAARSAPDAPVPEESSTAAAWPRRAAAMALAAAMMPKASSAAGVGGTYVTQNTDGRYSDKPTTPRDADVLKKAQNPYGDIKIESKYTGACGAGYKLNPDNSCTCVAPSCSGKDSNEEANARIIRSETKLKAGAPLFR